MEENEVIEENDAPTTKSVAKKWGLINGVIAIALFIIYDILNVMGESWVSFIGLVIFVVIVVLAHNEFKKEGDGYMSYGQGLGLGTLASLISAIISSAFTFIYVSFINTELPDFLRERQIESMLESGQSQSQIDQAMPFLEMTTSPVAMVIFGVVFGVFFGFLVSLLVSAFTKNQAPELR
ncbi:MAG: DUF4199 domain-containing protein [Cyclobacteriaceae bacterium]